MNKREAKKILQRFCSFDISSSADVLKAFAALPSAISFFDGGKNNFVYVPGKREDRVLLVAHADTVWDSFYTGQTFEQTLRRRIGGYSGTNPLCGIGADDRAGCAILWLLKDSGHSLLVVDGEEHGQIGSNHIFMHYPEIFDEINRHSYIIQFDRRQHKNYKVYRLPVTEQFRKFVEKSTGYTDSGKTARTDIVILCRDICGVNLSLGYYNEHTPRERIVFNHWFKTVILTEKMLRYPQNRFPLSEERETLY